MKLYKSFFVISDTHGLGKEIISSLLPAINNSDALIHLGDGLSDLYPFRDKIKCDILKVRGNCDLLCDCEKDIFINTPAGKVMFTHGDEHRVRSGLLNLYMFAKENGCKYAFYGHTHISGIDEYNGITIVNPGSACRPRDFSPTYCYCFIENNKLITKIVSI